MDYTLAIQPTVLAWLGEKYIARREEADRISKQEALREQALAEAAQNAIRGEST